MQSVLETEEMALMNELKELLPSMDKPNREKVAKEVGVSERTVYRYLCGEIAFIDMAKKIIDECRKNISARIYELRKIIK